MTQSNSSSLKAIITRFESDWHYLPIIKALSAIAALLHDWGKATALFQNKLKTNCRLGDPIRHEWISCLLLNAFIKASDPSEDDSVWLTKLIDGSLNEEQLKTSIAQPKAKPFEKLPPAASLLIWLIVSHHRLPLPPNKNDYKDEPATDIDSILNIINQSWGYENRHDEKEYEESLKDCFNFPNGLLSQSSIWLRQLKKWAARLRDALPMIRKCVADGSYRLIVQHARLCLMLGDHAYSSQEADKNWQDTTGLFANTDKTKALKQKLDEHLVGVAKNAVRIAHLLPSFERELPGAEGIPSLKTPSPKPYAWQDNAVEKIQLYRKSEAHTQHGFFAVNMASTGCGKTFANAKIMRALGDDGDSIRYILALGLRTLTLQTGEEYRSRIGLDDTELAVLIGSKAVMELYSKAAPEENSFDPEQLGSESMEALMNEDIDYDCDIPEDNLTTVLKMRRDKQFLYAPVLVCTIDHMMAATETIRGGHYILPVLRLMSSDLVIDEVDDFSGSDLIAIGRLIHLAGMLGRKVMISSATIPPALAEGYFNAYQTGWQIYSKTRDCSNKIHCAWIDEFKTTIETIDQCQASKAIEFYRLNHENFVVKRAEKLMRQTIKRKATISPCQLKPEDEATKQLSYFSVIQQSALDLHQGHHTEDKQTGRKVSFGVARMANVRPCVELSQYFLESEWPDDIDVKIMTYHSQQVLLLRHEQEKHLDAVLKRKEAAGEQPYAFQDPIIRQHLDAGSASHMLFILVVTPVEEIGHDHDFDWAVVEPSSYCSIIQLAGRVRRHRDEGVNTPNIALMQYNWRAYSENDRQHEKYFKYPGYEELDSLSSHDLFELIDSEAIAQTINAVPRIQKPKESLNDTIAAKSSLIALEHTVIHRQLTNYCKQGPESLQGYLTQTWHLTALPQFFNPFRKSEQTTKLFLMYDPDKDHCVFIEKNIEGQPVKVENILSIKHMEMSDNMKNRLWLVRDYLTAIQQLSEKDTCGKHYISLRYGELCFVYRENQIYNYSDQLGLVNTNRESM